MANTVIALKKSAISGNVPAASNLTYGELAINYADGKLYFKNTNNQVVEISGAGGGGNFFGTVNANGTLVVADTTGDVVTLVPGNNISIVGDAVNDKITVALKDDVTITGTFLVDNGVGAGGSVEGGEIRLANATASSVLTGPVAIDIYGNKLRIFETQGTNRGAYIDLSAASTGVGSDLLSPGSTTDGVARAAASAAYDKANSGNIIASSAYDKANAANVLAFNALPNTDGVTFSGTLTASKNLVADKIIASNNNYGENFRIGDDAWLGDVNIADTFRIKGAQDPTRAYVIFNTSDTKALGRAGSGALTWDGNTLWHAGNDGTGTGLDADLLDGQHGSYYATATDSASAFAKANTANITADLAYNKANAANIIADLSYNKANGANLLAYQIGGAVTGLNTVATTANTSYDKANGANLLAYQIGSAVTGLNTTVQIANTAYDKANAANLLAYQGNANAVFANTVANFANAVAIAAFNYANTISSDADEKANAAIITANTAYDKANAAHLTANTSYDKANAAHLTANTAYDKGNASHLTANAAYDKANAANILVYQIGGAVNDLNTTVTIANTAYDKANAANLLAFQANANAIFANTVAIAAFNSSNAVNSYSDGVYVKLTAAQQTITGNLAIVGNLTLSGNTVFVNASRLQVDDPLIYLAGNNYVSDIVDIGFIANYVNSTGSNVHTGLYREHTDKMYYLFQGYDQEPINNHIGALSNNMTLAVLNADLITSNLTLAGVNAVITLRSSYDKGNAAHDTANASYDKANAANILAYQANANAIFANIVAILAYDKANASNLLAYQGNANAIFANAIAVLAYNKGNAAHLTANTAYDKGNAAHLTANSSYDKANSANILAFEIGGAVTGLNTTVTYANSAWDKANAANYYAYLVDANAKAAFDKANTGGGGGASVNVGNTQPTGNSNGDLWWNTDLGRLLIYYVDVDSEQWVDATPVGDVGPQGNAGNIEIGTTTTTAPLSLPTVTNSGNGNYAVINFTIPRPSNVISNNTISIAPSQAPNVNGFYLANNDLGLNFYLPRSANLFVGDVVTGAPGSIVIISPTTESNGDVTLDFTIPRGNDSVTVLSDESTVERYIVFADAASGTLSKANVNTNFRFIASNGRLEVGGTINAANVLINNQPIVFDLTPANNWANTVAVVANNFALAIVTANTAAANGWANNIGVVANTFSASLTRANVAAANGWANNIGVVANNFALAIVTANTAAANGWANTKLSNATGTFAGSLTTTGTITGTLITGRATGGEGGEINLNNPSDDAIGMVVDVGPTANIGRVFSTLNNFQLRLGQLSGTGGNTQFYTAGVERARIESTGRVGIGVTNPTANLHLSAGVAAASGAPLKFTSGTNLTTIEPGAVEYDGTSFFMTPSTNFGRAMIPLTIYTSGAGTAGITLNTDYALFPAASDTITLPVGTYLVTMRILIIATGGTVSSTWGINIRGGGTAVGSFNLAALFCPFNGDRFNAPAGGWTSAALGTAITVTEAADVAPFQRHLYGTGLLKVTTAGTIIPCYRWSATLTSSTITLSADNFMIIQQIDTQSAAAFGPAGAGWG